jgi:putative ABC transport system substrate-binding protein
VTPRRAALRLLLALALWPAPRAAAAAGGVLAVTDSRVPQYKEALAAAQGVLHDMTVVELRAADAAAQVKAAAPAVILAVGQKALQVAGAAAPQTPVVYCMVLGNAAVSTRTVTGVRLEVAPATQLRHYKDVAPSARRIGVIYDPRASERYVDEALRAAGQIGLTLVAKPVSDARQVRSALAQIADGIDALWLTPDPALVSAEMFNFLLVFTLEHKIALYGFLDSFTKAGALASVAPDYRAVGGQAARMVRDLISRPAAERLPVPAPIPSLGELSINVKTAKQLGLEIPQSTLAKAQQVYR